MANYLVSGDVKQKIRWYIRAHGHSSIGGLNLIWTYFNYSGKVEIADAVHKAIECFEMFEKAEDVSEQHKVLEQLVLGVKEEIKSSGIDAEKKDEIEQILEGVKRNIERIGNIIQDPSYEEDFQLGDIIQSAITELLKRYPNVLYGDLVGEKGDHVGDRIRINFEEHENEKEILCCGYELQLLFFNLLSNAIDSIIEESGKGNIWISFDYLEDNVRIEAADDGEMISQENIDKIIARKSFTTKGRKHGHGMKIIYDIIDKYKASMEIESVEIESREGSEIDKPCTAGQEMAGHDASEVEKPGQRRERHGFHKTTFIMRLPYWRQT